MRIRVMTWILLIAICLRLCAFVFAVHSVGVNSFVSGDAIGYVALAQNLSVGNGFSQYGGDAASPEVFRTPGFPLLLAPFMRTSEPLIYFGLFFSVVAGILLPLLTYEIGCRLTDRRAALVAAIIMACEPHAIFYSFLPQTEMSFMLFAFGGFLAGILAWERSSYLYALFSGALAGYSVFIRPSYYTVLLVAGIGIVAGLYALRDIRYRYVVLTLLMLCAVVLPWQIRTYQLTGALSLSGAGWRNVYTDYLASVRALEKGTKFDVEKSELKDEAKARFGLSRSEIDDPKNARALRDYVLPELWRHKITVVKLEATLLTSFLIQDGYYYEFRNVGFINDDGGPHISPTYELLTHGVQGLPVIWRELSRQLFIPVLGRIFTISILIASIFGFFLVRNRLKYALLTVVALTALFATVIGLGVDARMRVPLEPLFFIFAATAFVWIFDRIRLHYAR